MLSKIAFIGMVMIATAHSNHATQHPLERPIRIKNESGQTTEVYWVDPSGGEMLLQTRAMMNGQTLSLNSYINHTFLVRELPGDSGTCNAGTTYASPSLAPCKTAFITVNDHDDQVIHILQHMEVEVEDSNSKVQELSDSITSKCQEKVKQQIKVNDLNPSDAVDAFVSCAQPLVTRQIEESNKEIKEHADIRIGMAEQWEDYTCSDFELSTTTPKSIHNWSYQGKDHRVGVLLDRDEAKIHYIKNFITPDECAAIESAAAPTLHKATVADGSGGSELKSSRKALQAGVKVPWNKEHEGDLIARVSRRLYTYINDATGYGIREAGQEDLMSIQYFGRGVNDPEPDRYMPHCDGQCDGLKFQDAGRVATMVMYWKLPRRVGRPTSVTWAYMCCLRRELPPFSAILASVALLMIILQNTAAVLLWRAVRKLQCSGYGWAWMKIILGMHSTL
eukprot:445761_1